ncbi:MAG TPA: cyclic nucleotide-binding domain-containing protein [Actinomycetota bacterium]|nr:cyclic nucleotide-binding domain-containing protein [Actinomycetota bacterium]
MLISSDESTLDLFYRLKGLPNAAAVLHVGAHPDDEDVGFMTYLERKLGLRVVYWSATRGEGGQNRLNSYSDEALGVYRTWESLAARRSGGGECLFGPFFDFGYSKNGEEALSKWGRESVIREIVRAIRLVQPHIVVSRWTGEKDFDQHGHHQAIGIATYEAFDLAADETRFPELTGYGLGPWQPLKLLHSGSGDWTPGQSGGAFGAVDESLEQQGAVRINAGEFDPAAGRTFQEQAWIGFNEHKTQAMGNLPAPGDFLYYFKLHSSLVGDRTDDLFDGIDTSLAGLADHPGAGNEVLRAVLENAASSAKEAFDAFTLQRPNTAAKALLEGIGHLGEARTKLHSLELGQSAGESIDRYLSRKEHDFESAAALCLGLELECTTEDGRVFPGQSFKVSARLRNNGGVTVDKASFSLDMPDDWGANPEEEVDESSADGFSAAFTIDVPRQAQLTTPYWLEQPRTLYSYGWPAGEPCARPFELRFPEVECEVEIEGGRLVVRSPALFRQAFPGGYRELPVAVIPPISLEPHSKDEFVPAAGGEPRVLELSVAAANNTLGSIKGELALAVPPDWKVEPGPLNVELERDQSQTIRHTVTIPANINPDRYFATYQITVDEREYSLNLTPVWMGPAHLSEQTDATNCIKEEFIMSPSQVRIDCIDAQFVEGLTYGYIEGAEEQVMKSLRPFNLDFVTISDEDLAYLDLSAFDAIVVGPNAYLIRSELRAQAERLLEYVRSGGTLIVQYQGFGYQHGEFAPYPFRYNEPHDRVTIEESPVEILHPEHSIFNWPNQIGAGDFERWIMDRGMYFFGEWDTRYVPLLGSADPGEPPTLGGLLYASYGKGTYLYLGYSLWRQIPAGIRGAHRIFANVLSLPAAIRRERQELLKASPLFSSLNDEELVDLGKLMSEEWFEDGAEIAVAEEAAPQMFVVSHGQVEVVTSSDGKESVTSVLGPGESVGEYEMLGRGPRDHSLRAKGETVVLAIEHEDVLALLRTHPGISEQIILYLTRAVTGRNRT